MQPQLQYQPIGNLGLRGLAWIFAGIIYGFTFVSVAQSTLDAVGPAYNVVLATIVTPALTALIYSSMRLTVVIANVVLVVTLLFTMFGGDSGYLSPHLLIQIPAALGMLIGAWYGWRDRGSRICCADAKILDGLFVGLATSLLTGLAIVLFGSSNAVVYPWLVTCLAPLAGALYMATVPWFLRRLNKLLPPAGDGAVVGLGVGILTGLLFVVIAGSFEPDVPGGSGELSFIESIYDVLGTTLIGTAASCFVLGAVRQLLGLPWYRL